MSLETIVPLSDGAIAKSPGEWMRRDEQNAGDRLVAVDFDCHLFRAH